MDNVYLTILCLLFLWVTIWTIYFKWLTNPGDRLNVWINEGFCGSHLSSPQSSKEGCKSYCPLVMKPLEEGPSEKSKCCPSRCLSVRLSPWFSVCTVCVSSSSGMRLKETICWSICLPLCFHLCYPQSGLAFPLPILFVCWSSGVRQVNSQRGGQRLCPL